MEIVARFLTVLLALAIPVAFAGNKQYGVAVVTYLVFAFFAMSASVNLAFEFCLASVAILLVLRKLHARPKLVVAILSLWTLALPIVGMRSGAREYRERHAKYPIETLIERLAYESLHATAETSAEHKTQNDSAVASRDWIREFDVPHWAQQRHDALERLHTQTFSQFVSAFGFGASRMTAIQNHLISYDPWTSPPETFPDRPRGLELPTAINDPRQAIDIKEIRKGDPLPRQLEVVHQFTSDVASAYVPSRRQAAGFRAHRLVQTPALHGDSPDKWQISRLDLVSLLKFESPRVYLSEHLPRMEELRNAETRPVDHFEQRALEQLRDGEDIVVGQQLNTIRMVGAVRAARQCLDCHSVRQGDLLGAFSYLLDRKQPIPPPKVEGKPVSMIWKRAQDS